MQTTKIIDLPNHLCRFSDIEPFIPWATTPYKLAYLAKTGRFPTHVSYGASQKSERVWRRTEIVDWMAATLSADFPDHVEAMRREWNIPDPSEKENTPPEKPKQKKKGARNDKE